MKLYEIHVHESSGVHKDGVYSFVDGKRDPRHVKFKNKDAFLKLCLQELKDDSDPSNVVEWIKAAKARGYDYPEFETILKSIGT